MPRSKRMKREEVDMMWENAHLQDFLSKKGRRHLLKKVDEMRRILNELDSMGIDMTDTVSDALDDLEMEYLH